MDNTWSVGSKAEDQPEGLTIAFAELKRAENAVVRTAERLDLLGENLKLIIKKYNETETNSYVEPESDDPEDLLKSLRQTQQRHGEIATTLLSLRQEVASLLEDAIAAVAGLFGGSIDLAMQIADCFYDNEKIVRLTEELGVKSEVEVNKTRMRRLKETAAKALVDLDEDIRAHLGNMETIRTALMAMEG